MILEDRQSSDPSYDEDLIEREDEEKCRVSDIPIQSNLY